MPTTRPPWLTALALTVVVAAVGLFVGYPQIEPYGPHAAATVSWLACGLAVGGVYVHRPRPLVAWQLAAAAIFIGSLADTLLIIVGRPGQYSAPPVLVGYLLCYVAGLLALYQLVRRWPPTMQRAAILDSATLAIAWLTVLVSLSYNSLIDPTVPLAERGAAVLFPLLDAIVVAVLTRFWFVRHVRVPAAQLSMVSMFFLVAYHVLVLLDLRDGLGLDPRWNETWVLTFVVLALALSLPSIREVSASVGPVRGDFRRVQITAVTFSLAVPYLMLIGYGLVGGPPPWQVIAPGGLLISLLTAVRVWGLLMNVQERAHRGERLAEVDPLTGAPNRRRWDAAVAEAARTVGSRQVPWFWVAMLDMDHFKRFNDVHGHQAGDRLLQAAVHAWQTQLHEGDLLARYGGEEFALLLVGRSKQQVEDLLNALRTATPDRQTCSVGAARWRDGSSVGELMAAADTALYAAKRLGRDRVIVAKQREPAE